MKGNVKHHLSPKMSALTVYVALFIALDQSSLGNNFSQKKRFVSIQLGKDPKCMRCLTIAIGVETNPSMIRQS